MAAAGLRALAAWAACVCVCAAEAREGPGAARGGPAAVVASSSGALRGRREAGYLAYRGVPYARSVAGSHRFKPPRLVKPWKGILDASKEGPVCYQLPKFYSYDKMAENCLFVNIYVPENTTRLLPAVVHVHPGQFKYMSTSLFDPRYLLEKDLIHVSVTYRLGPLGFLSMGTKEAPGNAGLHDLLLALKWIRENLERFRGDRNRVTIMGTSSSSAMIQHLMMSPRSRGLFQQVIAIAGSALNQRFFSNHPIDVAKLFAKELGINSNNTETIIKELKRVKPRDMVEENLYNYYSPFAKVIQLSWFVPCVESNGEDSIVTDIPITTMEARKTPNVPMLAGVTANEGLLLYFFSQPHNIHDIIKNNTEILVPSDIEYPQGSDASKKLIRKILKFYFNEKISKETAPKLLNYISDVSFLYGTISWLKNYKARRDKNNVYFYVFDFDGAFNFLKVMLKVTLPGVTHGDEHGYVFDMPIETTPDPLSLDMRNTFVTYLSNFIKYSNPTPDEEGMSVKWPDCGVDMDKFLYLSSRPPVVKHYPPFRRGFKFWTKVYDEYYRYVRDGGPTQKKLSP